ncbi:MotA/TolQ/ExbB proton channel family protein [Nitrospira sp. Kam-Ns4a]
MAFHQAPTGLFDSLGTVSKVVLLILFLFSVTSWAIILYKWRAFRISDREDRRFLSAYGRDQDLDEVRRHARRCPASPMAAVCLGVLERAVPEDNGLLRTALPVGLGDSPSEQPTIDRQYLDRVAAHLVHGQIAKQEALLPFLATTGNTTPFIGLLGTVMGIINAFQEIGVQGTASIGAVAPGVAEALVATAAGLFTAIPAVIAYNYFLSHIRKAAFRLEAFTTELLSALALRARAAEVRP